LEYIFDLLIQFVIIRSPRLLLGFSSFKFVYALTRFLFQDLNVFINILIFNGFILIYHKVQNGIRSSNTQQIRFFGWYININFIFYFYFIEDVSDPEETLTKAEEEKKKAAAVPHKKISKPLVSAKTLVTKDVAKPVVEKKDGADQPQRQTVRFVPGERNGTNSREPRNDQGTKWIENRPQQRRPPNSQSINFKTSYSNKILSMLRR